MVCLLCYSDIVVIFSFFLSNLIHAFLFTHPHYVYCGSAGHSGAYRMAFP